MALSADQAFHSARYARKRRGRDGATRGEPRGRRHRQPEREDAAAQTLGKVLREELNVAGEIPVIGGIVLAQGDFCAPIAR